MQVMVWSIAELMARAPTMRAIHPVILKIMSCNILPPSIPLLEASSQLQRKTQKVVRMPYSVADSITDPFWCSKSTFTEIGGNIQAYGFRS